MKFIFFMITILCFLSVADGQSQVPDYPADIEWNKAGVVTSFPDSSQVDNIFYVPSPSSNSDWKNIQATIDSAGAADGTNLVLLREGKYMVDRPLILEAGKHDNVYLKGAGPNHLMHTGRRTLLVFDYTDPENFDVSVYGGMNAGIVLKGGYYRLLGTVTEYNSDTNQITMDSSNSILSEGDIVRVRSNRPGVSCKEHPCMGQFNRIKEVINNSPLILELDHDFSLTWDQQEEYGGLDLTIHSLEALQNVGISSLGMETVGYQPDPLPDHFECRDEPAASRSPHGFHILAFRVYNAHIKDLSSYKPIAHHVHMLESLNNTISENFFNDAMYRHGCNGGHGYGVNLWRKSTLNLVENNIFRHLRRSLMFNRGVHKNVLGYNYSREVSAQTGSQVRGDLSSRNMSDSGNLAEGNQVDRILNDTYHESTYTAYKNVYFRNSTYYNYMENEGGIENYFIGNRGSFSGNHDPSSLQTELYAFQDSVAITHGSSSSDHSNPDLTLNKASLYHSEVPHFLLQKDRWNQTYTWPPLGPRLSEAGQQLTQGIPARGRYCEAYNDYPDSSYHCSGAPGTPHVESEGEGQ